MGSGCSRWRQPAAGSPRYGPARSKRPLSPSQKRHFPDMAHLGDITRMDGGAIPPVHVLTFGSPCQNLSQIGNRDGLAGAKSSLFFQAIRIIKEMRDATDNLFPVIAVWENVMGAFSSNDRMDFRAVLSVVQRRRCSNACFWKMGGSRNGARGNA